MKRATTAALLLAAATLAGCAAGEDPALGSDCAQRAAGSVVVGTGSDAFAPAGAGVLITHGPQGGFHIWMSVRCHGLGPTATVRYGIEDATSGTAVSSAGLMASVELTYEGEGDDAAGLYGFLDAAVDPASLVGTKVVLWAGVTDACHATPVRGETSAVVTGFDHQGP